MKILSLLFTIVFLSAGSLNSVFAQEEENEDILLSDPYLSVLYQRGRHLLYNCIDKHWVCTGKAEFDSCIETRNESLKDNDTNLPCAPVRIFISEDECVAHQASIINAATENRFCLHPNRRAEELVY